MSLLKELSILVLVLLVLSLLVLLLLVIGGDLLFCADKYTKIKMRVQLVQLLGGNSMAGIVIGGIVIGGNDIADIVIGYWS